MGLKPINKGFKEATFMSMVRWRLVNILNCNHTYGYATKSKRIELGLEKTHYNDAFIIAGGDTQKRAEQIMFKQVRRNNRSLRDSMTLNILILGLAKVSGQDLLNGKELNKT